MSTSTSVAKANVLNKLVKIFYATFSWNILKKYMMKKLEEAKLTYTSNKQF